MKLVRIKLKIPIGYLNVFIFSHWLFKLSHPLPLVIKMASSILHLPLAVLVNSAKLSRPNLWWLYTPTITMPEAREFPTREVPFDLFHYDGGKYTRFVFCFCLDAPNLMKYSQHIVLYSLAETYQAANGNDQPKHCIHNCCHRLQLCLVSLHRCLHQENDLFSHLAEVWVLKSLCDDAAADDE